jgi:hypothetical protein
MKKSITKRLVSLLCVVATLLSMTSIFAVSASAASSKSYDCDVARVITVKTGSGGLTKPSITFKCKADKEFGSRGISSSAPIMSLKIYDHTTKTTTWKRITGWGSSISSTLKLERNRTYTITVSYIYDKSLNYNAMRVGGGKAWAEGTWYIASTNKVNSFSIR